MSIVQQKGVDSLIADCNIVHCSFGDLGHISGEKLTIKTVSVCVTTHTETVFISVCDAEKYKYFSASHTLIATCCFRSSWDLLHVYN